MTGVVGVKKSMLHEMFEKAKRNLENPAQLRATAVQFLAEGNEQEEAKVLSLCSIEYGDVRCMRGSVFEIDITLRCNREVFQKLRPTFDEYGHETRNRLAERLKEAVHASLPSGYGIANCDARAAAPPPIAAPHGKARIAGTTATVPQIRGRGGDGVGTGADPAPEYFLSLEDAAEYAGVSKRTIQNWKRRDWLKVEQEGRKIRISRAELDKCKK